MVLTGSLLFLFKFLFLFNIICLCIKIIVSVFGKLPFIILVAQVRRPASEVYVELLDVNLHDAAVHGHANLIWWRKILKVKHFLCPDYIRTVNHNLNRSLIV